MKHAIDAALRAEAAAFSLRFACPDCAMFDEEGGRCSLGFPNEEHIDPDLRTDTRPDRREVVFCKTFELR